MEALYPMVTMNGEVSQRVESLEEIHRNGAIGYAIYNYIRYTDDKGVAEYGLEVLVALARFWARATYSESRGQYVILGVTGPNEYENNVNATGTPTSSPLGFEVCKRVGVGPKRPGGVCEDCS